MGYLRDRSVRSWVISASDAHSRTCLFRIMNCSSAHQFCFWFLLFLFYRLATEISDDDRRDTINVLSAQIVNFHALTATKKPIFKANVCYIWQIAVPLVSGGGGIAPLMFSNLEPHFRTILQIQVQITWNRRSKCKVIYFLSLPTVDKV